MQELECQLQQEQAGIADAVMDLVVSDTVSSASEKALITELASAKAALESEQAGVVTAVVKMAMSKVISRSSEEDLKTKLTAVKAALEDEKGRAVSEAAALQALANNHQQQLEVCPCCCLKHLVIPFPAPAIFKHAFLVPMVQSCGCFFTLFMLRQEAQHTLLP